jgi:hypothetical protein
MPEPTPADPAGRLDAEGVPEDDLYPGLAGTGGDYEEMAAPRETPGPSVDYGITAAEERTDEPLALRVAREEPDVLPVGDEEPVADLEGDPLVARSPEEEAVHIIEEG